MASVSLQSVWKTYPGGVHAVRGFDLDAQHGQFVVIVGGSGCGKSTTLRMIAGLETVTKGEILIGDRAVTELKAKERDIAMVFQNYALYPHLSVYDNISLGLKMRRVPKQVIRERVQQAAELLELTELLRRKPRALSGGQRQRVAVGRAIVREPSCFLFDEPLSNLDAKLRASTRAELKQLHRRLGATMIYVTHDQEEAMTLADQICVMADGRVQQIAPPFEIYSHPANRLVAGFMGTPSMNFVPGHFGQAATGAAAFLSDTADDHPRLEIPLTAEQRQRLDQQQSDGRVLLGLRPQSIRESAPSDIGDTGTHACRLDATVVFTEPLGDQMDLLFSACGHELRARIPASAGLSPGSAIRLWIEPELCHYFEDGEYGRRL
ncbi:MAG: sn-glycerol-3-phosphate ABC transporter ATP-binding protein UgpC [Planctomycetota bacterium]